MFCKIHPIQYLQSYANVSTRQMFSLQLAKMACPTVFQCDKSLLLIAWEFSQMKLQKVDPEKEALLTGHVSSQGQDHLNWNLSDTDKQKVLILIGCNTSKLHNLYDWHKKHLGDRLQTLFFFSHENSTYSHI